MQPPKQVLLLCRLCPSRFCISWSCRRSSGFCLHAVPRSGNVLEIRMTRAVLIAAVLEFFLTPELFGSTLSASNFNEKTVMDRGEVLPRRVKRYGERGHITIDTTNHDPFKEFNKESRKRQEKFQRQWDQLDRNSVFFFDLNKHGHIILISINLVKIFWFQSTWSKYFDLNKFGQNILISINLVKIFWSQ